MHTRTKSPKAMRACVGGVLTFGDSELAPAEGALLGGGDTAERFAGSSCQASKASSLISMHEICSQHLAQSHLNLTPTEIATKLTTLCG